METGILWFTVLATSILTIRVETSTVSYKVFTNTTTWKDAANACNELNGTLIDSSEYVDNSNNITLSENKTYWTSSFSFLTKWVELKGCFNIRVQNSTTAVCKQPAENTMDIGWSCYAYCETSTYFGIIDDVCVCFSELPANDNIGSSTNCPSCSNHSSYQCGVRGYMALYEKFVDESKGLPDMCMSYNCEPNSGSKTFKFLVRPCQESLEVRCSDGSISEQSKNWIAARQVCEDRDSFILRHPVADCTSSTTPYWDNIQRNIISFTSGFESRSGIRLHNRTLLNCSSITPGGGEPKYDKCNSSKDGYICKIEHSPKMHTPTICTINQTEPDVSTAPPTNSTGESISTDFNSSNNGQTTVPYTGQTIGNATKPDNMVLYIGIGAGVGGFIVIALIIIIIYICRKRSSRKGANEKESKDRNDIGLDEGQVNHLEAAERYVSMKSEKSTVKRTNIGKNDGGCYEQIVLPDEKPDDNFSNVNGIVGNGKRSQSCKDVPEASNEVEDTKFEDDYAELDNEADLNEKIPKICVQPETVTTKNNDQEEDDYDHFGQTNIRSSASSNYDHVHLKNSIESKKVHVDDTEDYDHIPGAAGRRNGAEVDSTYDHAHNFELRNSTSSNYDHVVLLGDQEDSVTNRISDDYDHTTNVSRVETEDDNRGSNYTQVTLPDPT